VLVAGCDDNGTAPTNPPLVFSALLSPANEVPPIGNAESTGRGAVQIMITGNTATFHFQLSGFPGNTTVVGAHIHPGAAGVNGSVIVSTGVSGAAPVSLPNGTGTFDVAGIPVDAATLQSIVNNPGGFYFNVHSPLNPGGFARGQLIRVQ
jgi:hypothetical protein